MESTISWERLLQPQTTIWDPSVMEEPLLDSILSGSYLIFMQGIPYCQPSQGSKASLEQVFFYGFPSLSPCTVYLLLLV